ncbi:MAG: efflux RND transporter periplasmic adaptor subunit [Silicimonas sp.]|nr:efflux RND transporter periplasmic adaptor subunit [Silicimonas sp.]
MSHVGRNIALGVLGAAVVGGLLFVTFRPEPVPVDLHEISTGTLSVTVEVDGETRVKEEYEIAAPIAGLARRLPVHVGDPVKAGETVVAEVEPTAPALLDARSRAQAEAAVHEAEAALQVAETDFARAGEEHSFAQSQFDRTSALVERGVASTTRLESANQVLTVSEAALNAARARIDQARSGLDRARAALFEAATPENGDACCVTIMAPADGVVLSIETESERPVQAGARLLSIGDPMELEIVADLLSSDAVRLPVDARASVERWGGPALEARLQRIEPSARTKVSALGIEEQRVDAIFELVSPVEKRPGLGHGFAVFLRIVEYEETDAILVPLSAVFRSGEGWSAFRVSDGVAERVVVEIGRRNARFASVVSGLDAGDRVVEHPSEKLDDGSPVVERRTY